MKLTLSHAGSQYAGSVTSPNPGDILPGCYALAEGSLQFRNDMTGETVAWGSKLHFQLIDQTRRDAAMIAQMADADHADAKLDAKLAADLDAADRLSTDSRLEKGVRAALALYAFRLSGFAA